MSEPSARKLLKALQSLPFFDHVYLSMQAQNIAAVDHVLERMEDDLYSEYMRTDQTPFDGFVLVSALSQMWVFALYELLRTWKQMARELVDYDKKLRLIRGQPGFDGKKAKIARPAKRGSDEFLEEIHSDRLRQVEIDASYASAVEKAVAQIQPAFQRLSNVRIALAKHEVAGAPGMKAFAPGYARFDHLTGSLCWIITLKDGTSDIISRRRIADSVREFLYPRSDEDDQQATEGEPPP
jgi:hypothetical protein